MANFPSFRPSGQQVSGQDLVNLNNKPSVKDLASKLAQSLPQQTNNNSNSVITNDINLLPPPMNFQPVDNGLPPPSDLPPMCPVDTVLETHEKALNIILPKPNVPLPTIEITSPKITDLRYSNKVNTNSPANERMKQLKERADNLGMTLPSISKDLQREIDALAKKQGYTFDKTYNFYINGKDIKTVEDFKAELSKGTVSTSDDEAVAKQLELKLMLESKQKEADQQEALTMQFLKDEEEKAKAEKQKADAKNLAAAMLVVDKKPARPLSDAIIKEYESNGWTLDDDGMFASHPNGEFKFYDDIKKEEAAKSLPKVNIKPASRPLSDEICTELEKSGWTLNDEGQFAMHQKDGLFLTYEDVKKKFG